MPFHIKLGETTSKEKERRGFFSEGTVSPVTTLIKEYRQRKEC